MLAATPYGHSARSWHAARALELRADGALAAAQHWIAAGLLWDLRVLAGWLPQGGAQLMRTLAGWFEIANVDERLQELAGRPAGEFFMLGALATAWPRLRSSASLADLRAALAASAWKDPGGETDAALAVGMRASWAVRVAGLGEPARTWAAGGVALLLAGWCTGGEPLHLGSPGGQNGSSADSGRDGWQAAGPVLRSAAVSLLGMRVAEAASLDELVGLLPGRLSWVFEDASTGSGAGVDLRLAEARWWQRIERDGVELLAGSGLDRRPVLGAVAVLAADARRVRMALAAAARGGALEVFDAVA